MVRMIFRALHNRAGGESSHIALIMAKTLISIAREWVKAPTEQISELKRLRSKFPTLSPGLTKKNKQLLARLDGPGAIDALLDLPSVLMSKAVPGRAVYRWCRSH
jgi:hypothetical protein